MKKINVRKLTLMFADLFLLLSSSAICNAIITIFDMGGIYSEKRFVLAAALGTFVSFLCLSISGAYTKQWRYFNIYDYISCLMGTTSGMVIAYLITGFLSAQVSMIFWLLYYLIATLAIVTFRLVFRRTFLTLTGTYCKNRKRTLIIGGGNACRVILAEMLTNDEACDYYPVCIVDDDPDKLHTAIRGVMIKGNTNDIPELCKSEDIRTIMFAIPSCPEEDRRRILAICSETKLEIKIIPYLSELLFENKSILNQVKNIRLEDLLGRDTITFDNEEVSRLVNDKVCMVTGGGGSIGSELCRQIAKYNPKQLIIIDIYENNAYEIQQELIMEYGDNLNLVTLISSVRDYQKMNLIFDKYRPNIVFHAAAHKHVPLMETVPEEAVKNNVIGTFNCATLADFYHADKFVLISTDKAVNPTNVMGATKRCCEMIAQYMSQEKTHTEFVAVRFGNVLGSNGSVIPLFKRQIEGGRDVTVTHPDIIRYFMTIPEAVSLVLQAGAMAKGGEIFVLDMGDPVKIVTLAENLIRQYGKEPYKDVNIRFTGLRPGEKLFEELLMSEEGLKSTANKRIFIGNQIEIDCEEFIGKLVRLKSAAGENDSESTTQILSDIVPTFKHAVYN